MNTIVIKINSKEPLHFKYIQNVLHENFDNIDVEHVKITSRKDT